MSLEREIRKIMAKSVFENFVNNPDCDICGDGHHAHVKSHKKLMKNSMKWILPNMFRKMMRENVLCLQ